MATGQFTEPQLREPQFREPRLNGEGFAESSLDATHFWAPPLAPAGTPAAADIALRQDPVESLTSGELPFEPSEHMDLADTETGWRSGRKLVAGAALVAALGAGALAYFFWAPAGEQATQTADAAPSVQSPAAAPVQPVPRPSPEPPAVAWPDLPPSATAEASPQVASAAPAGTSAARQTVPAAQNRDTVFLQRPNVNIRSAPSATGTVVGTAPKGARFKVTSRDGDWVQVESSRLKGWINSQFVGPNAPR
jgi:Bacterial SH3 domain